MPRVAARPRSPFASRPRRLVVALVAIAVLAVGEARPASARGVAFADGSDGFGEMLALAKALGPTRLVVVELFTERCAWCRALERETFGSDVVAAALEGDLCVRYDADSYAGKPVAERFGVGSYPTTLFLDPTGEEVDRLAGFVPAPRFLEETARIRAGTRTLKSLRAAHAAQPADAALAVAFARKLAHTGERDAARALLEPVVAATTPDVGVLPAALLGLAEVGNLEGDARLVDECLTKLLGRFPDAPEAADGWILQIDRLVLVGAYERAAAAAAEARRVVKDDAQLARLEERLATFERLRLEATLLRWGERADAAADLESLERAAKVALERRLALGSAVRWAERVAKAAPEDLDAVEVYADLLFETGRTERALRTATEAFGVTKDARVRDRLARRIAAWRAALGGTPSPVPSAADAPSADPGAVAPSSHEPAPEPAPSTPPSPPEPKPPCR